MRKHIHKTLLLLSLILLFSCAGKRENIQEKAQNLIIAKYTNIFPSKPIFEFKYDIVKYDKERNGIFSPLLKYAAAVDEYITKDIGYILKYIVIIDGITFVFVATLCKDVESIITHKLYENVLHSNGIVNVQKLIK